MVCEINVDCLMQLLSLAIRKFVKSKPAVAPMEIPIARTSGLLGELCDISELSGINSSI